METFAIPPQTYHQRAFITGFSVTKQLQHIVSLSEPAFFSIVAAALEAYEIARVNSVATPHVPLESYGNLWGYQARSKRNERVLHISMADVETSADCQTGSVQPQDGSFILKQDLIDRFRPELEYLGDFHSHPYDLKNDKLKSALEVERGGYYRFSNGDREHVKNLKETRNYRVGLVTTVFKLAQGVRRKDEYVRTDTENYSCIRFSYDDFTIWIKAHVYADKNAIDDQRIALLCPTIGFHTGMIEAK